MKVLADINKFLRPLNSYKFWKIRFEKLSKDNFE